MEKYEPIFEYLSSIAELIPAIVYWTDTDGRFLGANKKCLEAGGAIISKEDFIGKLAYEFYRGRYSEDIAKELQDDFNHVINTGLSSVREDKIIDVTTGKFLYFSATRAPLKNRNGDVIGLIGTSIEITAEKESIELKLENEAAKRVTEEQAKFRTTVGQMVHDIRTPLSTLQMVVQSTREIPEEKRISLRNAAITINDITAQLLRQYESTQHSEQQIHNPQVLLVPTILSDVVSDRRHKYKNSSLIFKYDITQLNAFTFIKADFSDLKRSISNLINNAVEALPKAGGMVEVQLIANEEWVYINILDNGCGISKELLDKIKQKTGVTHGKKNGHGLGMIQVIEMTERNHGKFNIASSTDKRNQGTTIMLQFPRVIDPDWIAEEVNLTKNDIVIILDDDGSIHGGWDSRLEHILEKIPSIVVEHYSHGQAALNFIANLPAKDKENVCFLSDYELIGQELNGIQVIEKAQIKRSILVTSHYANVEIRKMAVQHKVKILPKELVHIVPINVIQARAKDELVNVHMVFVDDEKAFTRALISNYYSHLVTDQYSNPLTFLDEVDKYPKDTRFILDNYYYMEDGSPYPIDGVTLAQQLHQKGFTTLYLLSGESFRIPDYLTLVLKTDQATLSKLDKLV